MQEQKETVTAKNDLSGPPCSNCGTIMQQTGHCFTCPECGTTSGCS